MQRKARLDYRKKKLSAVHTMLMCNGLLSCMLFHTKHIGSPDGTTGHRGPSGVPLSPLGPGNVQPQPPGCQCSCLMFGRSGRHAIHYGSARFITRQRGTEMKPSMAKYKEPAMRKSVVVWRWPAAVSGRAAKLSANRHKLLRFCSPRHFALPITLLPITWPHGAHAEQHRADLVVDVYCVLLYQCTL